MMRILIFILPLFLFGCSFKKIISSTEEKASNSEKENTESKLNSGYLIGKKRVSNNEYLEFLKSYEKIYGTDSALKYLPFDVHSQSVNFFVDSIKSQPVQNVSRLKANTYCNWKTKKQNFDQVVASGLLILSHNANEDCLSCINSYEDWVSLGKDFTNTPFKKIKMDKPVYGNSYWLIPYQQVLEEFKQKTDSESLPCELFNVRFNNKPLKIDSINCGFRIGLSPNSKLLVK